jgi:multicomponent Na+:H+ antiporter subunit F
MTGLIAAAALAVLLLLTMLRLVAGPTLHDRALAAHAIVLNAVLICAAIAVSAGRADWTDAAFALVLGSFVVHAAALKFFSAGTFQAPLARGEEEGR